MSATPALRAEPPRPKASSTPVDAIRDLATVLQLSRRAREAPSKETLGFLAVNETRQLFAYRQAAFGRGNAIAAPLPGEVLAVSGVPQLEQHAPYVQWLAQVLRHIATPVATRGGQAPFVLNAQHLPDLIARDWSAWWPSNVLVLPLPGPGGIVLGYVLLAREESWSERELALASELGHAYGFALARFVVKTSWRDRWRWAAWSRRHVWQIAAAVLAVCCFPVRLTVLAPAEVVAHEPFLVRAPLDGVIDRFHVRPNQPVRAGDALFDLDTTGLRARSGVARKAYDVAVEEYRQAAQMAVTDERSKLQMVLRKAELDEKALDLEYSEELLERVHVKAARDGVAVFADANDWQGKAVAIGERVLTLADPESVELQASLPVGNAIDLQVGSAVTLYPNASALDSHAATLESVAYRAEPTPDGVLAYRVKARFTGEQVPRLGTAGMAKLRAGRVPLIYFVLRRPFAAARQWLGW